jgi:hypothetical protein
MSKNVSYKISISGIVITIAPCPKCETICYKLHTAQAGSPNERQKVWISVSILVHPNGLLNKTSMMDELTP